MTDLTGVLTSTGLPLQTALQHNAVAMDTLRRMRAKEAQADADALHAAHALGLAEHEVESLQIRVRAAEQRAQQWQHASAGLPEISRSELPPAVDVDALRHALTAAEANLGEARREHARVCAVLRDAHNDAEAFKRAVYAPSPDIIEEG